MIPLSESLRLAAEDLARLDNPIFGESDNTALHIWTETHGVKQLLKIAADEIDRLKTQLINKSSYEKWLDEKRDRERD
jgi:hypothetical protein